MQMGPSLGRKMKEERSGTGRRLFSLFSIDGGLFEETTNLKKERTKTIKKI